LSIDGGVAIYEVADDVCNNPIILNKTTGGASWPATLTVSE
jgi:glycine cleavage system H lipoate-binding protein